jgi:hypothetical protein
VADVGAFIHVELRQQVEVPRSGVDFGGDLGIRERIGDLVGLAELALDLDEKRDHSRASCRRISDPNAAKSITSGKRACRRFAGELGIFQQSRGVPCQAERL